MFNRLALSTILCASVFLSACHKNTGSSDNAAPTGPYYTDATTQTYAQTVSSHVGIQIALHDPKDFANEYNYKRVLNLLDRHADVVSAKSADIEKIMIDGYNSFTQDGARYIAHVSLDTSESALVKLFAQDFDEEKQANDGSRKFAAVSSIRIVDNVGYADSDIPGIAAKLGRIMSMVDFQQDASFTTLTLSDFYGIVPNGMAINMGASDFDIVNQLKQAIEARLEWSLQMSPLLAGLGLNLTYQPGVFVGSELSELMFTIKRQATIIKSLSHQFTTFIVGKRWDVNVASATLLIDYKATDAEVTAKLNQLEPSIVTSIDFTSVKTNLLAVLASRGLTNIQVSIDLPQTASSIELVKSFTMNVAPNMRIDLIQQIGAKALRLNLDRTAFVAGSSSLYVLLPTSSDQLEQFMSSQMLGSAFETATLTLQQSAMIVGVRSSVSIPTPTAIINDRLNSFNQWFKDTVTSQLVSKTSLYAVTIIDDSTTRTTFDSGTLTVNLEDFNPNNMHQILFPRPVNGH